MYWKTQCCKITTFRPKILALLVLQFLRLRANFDVYLMLKAYFGIKSSSLVEKRLENLSLSVEIRILKALKYSGRNIWPYSTGFLSFDLTALGFSFVTFLHGGIDTKFTNNIKYVFILNRRTVRICGKYSPSNAAKLCINISKTVSLRVSNLSVFQAKLYTSCFNEVKLLFFRKRTRVMSR